MGRDEARPEVFRLACGASNKALIEEGGALRQRHLT
jgi:hypothetical protein